MSENSLGVIEPQSDEQKLERRKAIVEGMMVEKRDGRAVVFDPTKIVHAIENAAIAAGKSKQYVKESINGTVDRIIDEIIHRFKDNDFCPNVENIHDVVEKHLMVGNHYEVAKAYILFRADRLREAQEQRKKVTFLKKLTVEKTNGSKVLFNPQKLKACLARHAKGLKVNQEVVFEEAVKNIYSGIKSEEIEKALILATTSFIEIEPDYNVLASRLFLQKLKKEVFGHSSEVGSSEAEDDYRQSFADSIRIGVEAGTLDPRMLEYDLEALSKKLDLSRDNLFKFIGLSTLYERYFTQFDGRRLEMPQTFFMRVAMGLALNESDKEKWAAKFYDVMSKMHYMPSTPTLFHAGLSHPQLSSCYLTTVDDNLESIFQAFNDNAQLSKWSGGLGNDWTPIRSTGAFIKSTGVDSQGVIPFQHIANATTIAINRSGKRRGATCAYLEAWHCDIFDFIDLRRNTGDFRRRTHDMNTAVWIPDLFMERVEKGEKWTLFSPDEVPDLHELYGEAFRKAYTAYERKCKRGKIKKFQVIEAKLLYRRILERLFETGHPWLTWKDPCNVRSPQDHVGVVHSSNLCTEITLNTSPSEVISDKFEDGRRFREIKLGEVAVCNLGSVVLPNHIVEGGKIDQDQLNKTITLAMRMLDNVVGLNFYPIPEAEYANMQHRPVGLGIMGLQDALFKAGVNYEDSDNFCDELQELIAYNAISASSDLAKERGTYASFKGSKWDRGIFPLDTIKLLEDERGQKIDVNRKSRLDWKSLKKKVKEQGMRNSNTMAVAPTATISSIVGCLGPCGEALFKNIFVKANMTGEFTIVNEYLVEDLKKLKLWNRDMLDQIKFHDGSIQNIDEIPQELKDKYKEAFEIDPYRAIDLTALRGKWIDQSQSHNVFIRGKSGKLLAGLYMHAWKKGLKTTYYLRSLGASQIEKSTLDANKFGFTQKRETISNNGSPKACSLHDPDCEACQ
jgi:ribonucleoside-diphosphate reductase alpha chain